MTSLLLTGAGWTAFAVAAMLAVRAWQLALSRGEAVARACHEVRGPLAAARLGLEATLIASSAAYIRAIEAELARATVALDELQGVEWMRPDALGGELVDVRGWLTDSVEAWRPVAEACGMNMRLDWRGPEAVVWGHRSKLSQVTGNLIANAIDHGAGYVEVRGRLDGAHVVIEVLDGGPGLPAPPAALLEGTPDRAQLTGRGRSAQLTGRGRSAQLTGRGRKWGRRRWRAGRGSAPLNGRGHGLLIARAVAEAHGGRLATAPSERGARLVLTLPAALD
jgi:signal transduction histidine kinase